MMESYDYEEKNGATDVREALILAGIAEIEEHGPDSFSLRRVASACGVSCAAPYKHFKSKEALLSAIVAYIDEKWLLLQQHILELFPAQGMDCLTELCLANIRFWIGNPHFRAVRMRAAFTAEGVFHATTSIGGAAESLLIKLMTEKGLSEEDVRAKLYTVRSLVTGAALMLEDGSLSNTPETFRMIRREISAVL